MQKKEQAEKEQRDYDEIMMKNKSDVFHGIT